MLRGQEGRPKICKRTVVVLVVGVMQCHSQCYRLIEHISHLYSCAVLFTWLLVSFS